MYRIIGPDHMDEQDQVKRFDSVDEALAHARTLAEDDAKGNNEPTGRFPSPPRHWVDAPREWESKVGWGVYYRSPYDGQLCQRCLYTVAEAAPDPIASAYDGSGILWQYIKLTEGIEDTSDLALNDGDTFTFDVRVRGRAKWDRNAGLLCVELIQEKTSPS